MAERLRLLLVLLATFLVARLAVRLASEGVLELNAELAAQSLAVGTLQLLALEPLRALRARRSAP